MPSREAAYADLVRLAMEAQDPGVLAARYLAPNLTGLLTGEPPPPIADLPEQGKVPSTDDPRTFGAGYEAADLLSYLAPGGGSKAAIAAGVLVPGARRALTAAERTAPYPGAKFPQYAHEYPPVGPPTMMPRTRGGTGFYPEKTPLPEVEPFLKERRRITEQMRREGYTPFYDPAKRFDVDPKFYPANVDTAREALPKKLETIEKHLTDIGSTESRKRLREAYKRGLALGDPTDWYMVGQLERDYIKELGASEGRKRFGTDFAAAMAATTSGMTPEANWLLAMYANFQRAKGRDFPTASHALPYPIGGGKFGPMGGLKEYQEMVEGGGLRALGAENPKRHDFAFSYLGHRDRPVMDEQMVTGMTPDRPGAPGMTYGLYSKVAGEETKRMKVQDARRLQEVGWHGFKKQEGRPFISTVNDTIERTHRLTGMPRQEILRGIIRGTIPIYGAAGAAVLSSDTD